MLESMQSFPRRKSLRAEGLILFMRLVILVSSALHNVHFVKYVFLPTEQAETCLKIYVLIYQLTWKENMICEEAVPFKL